MAVDIEKYLPHSYTIMIKLLIAIRARKEDYNTFIEEKLMDIYWKIQLLEVCVVLQLHLYLRIEKGVDVWVNTASMCVDDRISELFGESIIFEKREKERERWGLRNDDMIWIRTSELSEVD